jgi:hypothetical protein
MKRKFARVGMFGFGLRSLRIVPGQRDFTEATEVENERVWHTAENPSMTMVVSYFSTRSCSRRTAWYLSN